MATRIICNHTTCKHNYKKWCCKDNIELAWIPRKYADAKADMKCLNKEKVIKEKNP